MGTLLDAGPAGRTVSREWRRSRLDQQLTLALSSGCNTSPEVFRLPFGAVLVRYDRSFVSTQSDLLPTSSRACKFQP